MRRRRCRSSSEDELVQGLSSVKKKKLECQHIQKFDTPKECKDKTIQGRKSIFQGWERIYTKYSPSTEVTVSPIKAAQANLKNVLFDEEDPYIDMFTWVVNMSEQFFYDNSLLLLNSSKSDVELIKKSLRRNSKQIDLAFFKNLVNIGFLGRGNFGSVYRGTDMISKKNYAIKYVDPESEDAITHCENILDYMAERNSAIRAMNSPFVVAFFYSLQIKHMEGLFLIFELCVGDLSGFIQGILYSDHKDISRRLYNNEIDIIEELDKDVNVLDTSLMYIFELFCALDFLMKANIIHQDIKPDNLMISETFHLKIGDFGLVYRTRAVHRSTNNILVKHSEIDTTESSNYDIYVDGTPSYEDFELRLMDSEEKRHPYFKKVFKDNQKFDIDHLYYNKKKFFPSFLTDTWAAGVVCINLLFRGFHIFRPSHNCSTILTDVPRTNFNEFLVNLVARKCLYTKYIHLGLVSSGGSRHLELMQFIASIFRPRKVRSKAYSKTKYIYQFTKRIKQNYIDLNKFENIESFKARKFSSKNIFTLEVPEKVKTMFKTKITTRFVNFEDLLQELSGDNSKATVVEMNPGLTINYFH